MTINEQLQKIGLTKSEITIYLFLLEQGVSSPPDIARGTKIARTNCYNILKSLKQKQLIAEQTKNKRKVYLANDPQALIKDLETKKETMTQLLPDLRALYTTQKNKPKIKFYDGWKQIKEIYWQATQAKEIFAIGSTKHLNEIDPVFFSKFIKELKNNNVVLHDLLSYSSKEKTLPDTSNILKGLYSAKLIPEKYKNFRTDILIWDDNIALITLEEPIFGTILTNPLLSETFKIIFNIVTDSLE